MESVAGMGGDWTGNTAIVADARAVTSVQRQGCAGSGSRVTVTSSSLPKKQPATPPASEAPGKRNAIE
jgi:type II secretory pathway component HofQ